MNADEFRRAGRDMIEWIIDYRERRSAENPVRSTVAPGDVAGMLPAEAPERGEPWDDIAADLDRVLLPGITHWNHPRFFGYFPANSSYEAILGELLSAGLGVQGMLWQTSPACTEVETVVMDWLGKAIGLPSTFLAEGGVGGGVIQGTASEAVLCAMVAARHRAEKANAHGPFVAYASMHAHSSVVKAGMVAGLGRDNVRTVPVNNDLSMDAEALERMIAGDRAAGRTPFFVCATIGATGTGAVDPLDAVGRIVEREGLWLHVDAAWAGAAFVCPEHRWLMGGVERAHTFNFNPHKWLLVNFDCSALWVRNRSLLIDAMSITPEYLRNQASDAGAVIDYRDWHVPLGRRFRALKLWFVLRSYGLEGLREHIRHHIRLADLFEQLMRPDVRFELRWRNLTLLTFRLREGDDATRALMERLNDEGDMFLTHTVAPLDGRDRYFIRFSIGGATTTEDDIRRAWERLQAAVW